MGLADDLESLVDGAYAAALDDTLWTPWSRRMIAALGGVGGAFHVIDRRQGILHSNFHTEQEVIDAYWDAGLIDREPQVPVVMALTSSAIYLDTDHLDRADRSVADFMKWLNAYPRWNHHMTAVSVLGDGDLRAALSIHRHNADGHTPTDEQRKLTAIFPQIDRAMQLGFRHAEKLAEAYWAGLATTAAEPALLLDEYGRILRVTAPMAALLAAADGLDAPGGGLAARAARDDAALQALLYRAVANPPRAGAARIGRPSGRAPFVVTAYPLPRRHRLLAPAEAAALVIVVDPAAPAAAASQLHREAFGLTPREADLAALLMAGHSVESAAASLAMALATARTHLRGLMAKTGVTRQAELVGLLSRIG